MSITVTATRNGGGTKWTNTFPTVQEWITACQEAHPDDQLWEPLDEQVAEGNYPSEADWLEAANAIVESADAVTIQIEEAA
jgi:hypothetical protein